MSLLQQTSLRQTRCDSKPVQVFIRIPDCSNDIENARDSEQLLIQENEQLQAQLATVQAQMQTVHEDGMAAQAQVAQLQVENSSLKSALEAERLMENELRVDLAKASLRIEEYLPRLENELKESRLLLTEAYKAQVNAELNAAVAIERAAGLEQRLDELKR
jgi:chromosome segregation ATPase